MRGGVRFPNEVGAWWPSVYGGPNPKALHFQPWVGVGLEIGRHCTALTGAWPFTLNTKKTYLTRVFACVIVSTPTFAGSDQKGGFYHWRGDLALLVFFFFWAGNRK